jgi:hypothetical protein
MKRFLPAIVAVALFAAGCTDSNPPEQNASAAAVAPGDAKVRATLNKLPAEDRPLAEEQKYCAVMTESRLGSMGVPVKLDIRGQPVFICCKGCDKSALKNPDQTLQTVAELKAKARAEK